MPSAKPTQPPDSDFATMEQAWYENLRRPDGKPYEVFNNQTLTLWKRWVGGEFEFDGKGLRDVVNANALLLDMVDNNLHAHLAVDKDRHAALAARVAAVEAQLAQSPFPA